MKRILLFVAITVVLSSQAALAEWLSEPCVFEPTYCADQNDDVERVEHYDPAKLLEHWKLYGIKEGRRSSPVFDVKYYLQKNPDLARQFGQKNFEEAARRQNTGSTTGAKRAEPATPTSM